MNQILQKLQHDVLTITLLSLTSREWDVLIQSTYFLSNKEIADILCVSPESVSNYKTRIKEKLHLDKGNGSLSKFLVNNLDNIKEIHTVVNLLR
jgi:DNA-binding NarL/FixJ family response regulator